MLALARVNSAVGRFIHMIGLLLALLLVLTPGQSGATTISDRQKKDFVKLVRTLPHRGEFFTLDAIKTAGPYLPVLFALTDKDLEGLDIYPFLALSMGLCDTKERRQYAIVHFRDIQDSRLKVFWAAMLFDETNPSSEVVHFLKDALESEALSKFLGEITGPNFAKFKTRVNAARDN